MPDEFKAIAETEPLIANKQFFYQAEIDSSLLSKDKLIDTIMEYYLACFPVNEFFRKAIKS